MIAYRPKSSEAEFPWASTSTGFGAEKAKLIAPISPEAVDLQFVLFETLAVLERLAHKAEIPEIFDLPPRSKERIKVRIRDRGPASFYLVTEESDLD